MTPAPGRRGHVLRGLVLLAFPLAPALLLVVAGLLLVQDRFAPLAAIPAVLLMAVALGTTMALVTALRAVRGRPYERDVVTSALTRYDAPGLWAVVDDVVRTVGAPAVDHLKTGEAVNARAHLGGGRTLYLGLPLLGVLGSTIARHFAELHVSHGVDLRCAVQPAAITGVAGRVTGVELPDGTHLRADAVIVGVGVTPRTELADSAGLDVDDGILVDASLRTSHPDVFAAGDVARAWHPLLKQRVRVEHWTNASWQPRVAAQAMLGADVVYDRLPHFFSDQYDMSMEYTGYVGRDGYDDVVVRGDPAGRSYLAFWLRGGRAIAGMSVNNPRASRDITALVRSAAPIDPRNLADATQPLEALAHT